LDALAQAQAFMKETGEHYYKAERHRLHGDVMACMHPGSAAAERSYQRAMEIATAQGALAHQLRAAVSLARLWRTGGQADKASELLKTNLQSWDLSEPHPLLLEAQELLEELRAAKPD
jgi:adenylate cyclase